MKLKTNQGDEFLIDDEDYDLIKHFGLSTKTNIYIRKDGTKLIQKYVRFWLDGKDNFLHRFLLDAPKGMEVDHINGNSLDNRKVNLRICSRSQNMRNRRTVRGKSKYRGVSWCGRDSKWASQIKKNNKQHFIGYFKNEIDAAKAYDKASEEMHGKHGCTNKELGLL